MSKFWYRERSVIETDEIGRGCIVHAPVWIGPKVTIGRNCKIQAFAFIPDGVHIANNVFIGPHVCFTNDKNPPSGQWIETCIESNVKIGAGAIILPGCHIRKGAIVGAGAVVTREVLRNTTVVGNPAREIIHNGKKYV